MNNTYESPLNSRYASEEMKSHQIKSSKLGESFGLL